ncbi:RsbRD N-terminal domain-containing protein [Chloroflexota bacterium]
MVLENLLSQKRAVILERWFQLVLETYPADTSGFLKQDKDRFTNPVGYTVSQEIKIIYEELLQDMDTDRLTVCLDNIIRIRSVQDFLPSQAVSFIFLLKTAVREEWARVNGEKDAVEQLLEFELRIDKLVLLALDIYMKCREKVFEIRVNEVKAEREMAFKVFERANLVR